MNLILTILKTVPLFRALSEEEHESIIEHIIMEYFPKDHLLFEKGTPGTAMYIIKSGQVRIFSPQDDAAGEPIELATLKEGDFFGEMALLSDESRSASAQTLTECEIFILKKEDFEALMQNSPEIAQKVQMAYQARTASTGSSSTA